VFTLAEESAVRFYPIFPGNRQEWRAREKEERMEE
jgi:hypothetical protein